MAITFSEISRMSLFRGFDEGFVRLLDVFFIENRYEKEQVIIEDGKLQDTFYVLISGEVEVYKSISNKRVNLATLQPGCFFGEINLFDPGLATANVMCLTPAVTLEINNPQFREFIRQRPELAADFTFQLAETVVRRFRTAHAAIEGTLMGTSAAKPL